MDVLATMMGYYMQAEDWDKAYDVQDLVDRLVMYRL
jgi:pentatricopeptide repeat protein